MKQYGLLLLILAGSVRFYADSVNLFLHHIAEQIEDYPMPGERRFPFELGRHDGHPKVPATALGPFVAGVARALVLDFKPFRLERGQFVADHFRCGHAGSTFLKGWTLTRAYTPAAT